MAPRNSEPKGGKAHPFGKVPPAGDAAGEAPSQLNKVIKSLDAASLSTPDLNHLMVHVANVVSVRNALQNNTTLTLPSVCYTRAADSDMVTLWSDGHVVGTTTAADAQARGIPACG